MVPKNVNVQPTPNQAFKVMMLDVLLTGILFICILYFKRVKSLLSNLSFYKFAKTKSKSNLLCLYEKGFSIVIL